MLNLIHAAEVQYRHDAARRNRDLLVLASIADRANGPAPTSRRLIPVPQIAQPARATVRAWPRPISEHVGLAPAPAISGAALACC